MLTLGYIVLVLVVVRIDPGLHIPALRHGPVRVASAALLVAAVLLYVRTITAVREAAAAGQLVIGGPFRYVRHPIYATYILLVCPAVMLVVASWPGLAIPLVAYCFFRLLIPREERRLRTRFGDEYRAYERQSNRILPRLRAQAEDAAQERQRLAS
jgi:protein-S-isoprenylcysteine O-methyltransferase Ste14